MDCTLLLLVMLLHVSSSAVTSTATVLDKSGDSATSALPCRRCKFYTVKDSSGGAPTSTSVGAPLETPSSGKKTNVGAVVALASVLVFIIAACCVCIYWNQSSESHVVTAQQLSTVQPVQPQQVVETPVSAHAQAQPSNARRPEMNGDAGEVMEPNGDGLRPMKPDMGLGLGQVQGQGERGDENKVVAQRPGKREKMKQILVEDVVGEEYGDDERCVRGREDVGGKLEDGVARNEGRKPLEEVVVERGSPRGMPKKYSYKLLRKVTNKFHARNKLGGGGFGNVYRATLEDGTIVAVKCLKCEGGKIDDFKNEVEALGTTNHPNLVKLVGYCDEGKNRLLVYEYMRNGSLDKWIFHARGSRSLNWPEMKNIIRGIAQGLEYLHDKCDKNILHRDLKPPNVILDDDKNAKLCDFGLAKLLNKDQSSTSTAVAGTMRYMAPEVLRHRRITNKVDVYSFGIVVLEVLFGKQYKDLVNSEQTDNSEVIKLPKLIKNLGQDMKKNGMEIKEFGNLAKDCIREKPEERPSMSEVVAAIRDLEACFKEAKAGRN